MLVQFSIKAQNPHVIRTCKILLLQQNLQLCYNAILNVESHCSSIVKQKKKTKTKKFILFHFFAFSHSQFCFSVSHLLFLSPKAPPSSVLILSLISHLSFSFKACIEVGLGLWSRHDNWCRFWISVDRQRSEIVVGYVWIGELCGSWVWSYGLGDGFG